MGRRCEVSVYCMLAWSMHEPKNGHCVCVYTDKYSLYQSIIDLSVLNYVSLLAELDFTASLFCRT